MVESDWGTYETCVWDNVETFYEYETPTSSCGGEYCCKYPDSYCYSDTTSTTGETCYEFCDTWCQPWGGVYEEVVEDWGTWNKCVMEDGCFYEHPDNTSGDYPDWCDTYCVPTGGEFIDEGSWHSCSWSDGVNEYGKCYYPYTFSWGDYCDTWCQPHDGHFVLVESDWGSYDECQWDNVVPYSESS